MQNELIKLKTEKMIGKILAVLIAITLFSCTKEVKQSNNQDRGKPVKEVVLSADLSLTLSGTTFSTTISPNAEWGGVQKFVTMSTNDGATSECNWNWSGVQAPASQTCSSSGTGFHRSWTSDKVTRDIHLSNVIQIQ